MDGLFQRFILWKIYRYYVHLGMHFKFVQYTYGWLWYLQYLQILHITCGKGPQTVGKCWNIRAISQCTKRTQLSLWYPLQKYKWPVLFLDKCIVSLLMTKNRISDMQLLQTFTTFEIAEIPSRFWGILAPRQCSLKTIPYTPCKNSIHFWLVCE